MITRLAYGSNQNVIGVAIMTGFTSVSDAQVNEALCWFERSRGNVAYIAILLRRYMSGWLASADPTIMTGCTIAAVNTHMVKRCISKIRDVVAHGAIRSGRQVICVLANTDYSVMAGFTVTCDTGMIKAARGKGTRRVTNTTVLGSRHMVERFAAGINAMAGCAIVHDD